MEITNRQYLESCLSFRYLSNLTIFIAVIAYYSQAYSVFFVMVPLLIANLVVILVVQWFNSAELFNGVFNISSQNDPINPIDPIDSTNLTKFILLNSIWHIISVIWLYGVLLRDDIIRVFHPNFMGVFMWCSIIAIVYFYYGSQMQIYGQINYLWYGGLYMAVLFITCYYLLFNL
jgi:hypothetical protein